MVMNILVIRRKKTEDTVTNRASSRFSRIIEGRVVLHDGLNWLEAVALVGLV